MRIVPAPCSPACAAAYASPERTRPCSISTSCSPATRPRGSTPTGRHRRSSARPGSTWSISTPSGSTASAPSWIFPPTSGDRARDKPCKADTALRIVFASAARRGRRSVGARLNRSALDVADFVQSQIARAIGRVEITVPHPARWPSACATAENARGCSHSHRPG